MADTVRRVEWLVEVDPSANSSPNYLYWPERKFWTVEDDDQFTRALSTTLPDMSQIMREDELVELEFDLLESYEETKRDQQELEARMWSVLRKNRLEDAYRSLFQVTTPLWFGLWIQSPLDAQHCSMLARLFRELWQGEMDKKDKRAFLNGLEAARRDNVPLYVTATPPGHTDMGWKTIFAHCPRCKANPPLEDHSIKVACPVCGHVYCPKETSSLTRLNFPR